MLGVWEEFENKVKRGDFRLNQYDCLLSKNKVERSKPGGSFYKGSLDPQRREGNKMSISLVFIHRLLKNIFKNFINSFNLSIALGVIRK